MLIRPDVIWKNLSRPLYHVHFTVIHTNSRHKCHESMKPWWYNQSKTRHNKTMYIFHGIYCRLNMVPHGDLILSLLWYDLKKGHNDLDMGWWEWVTRWWDMSKNSEVVIWPRSIYANVHISLFKCWISFEKRNVYLYIVSFLLLKWYK